MRNLFNAVALAAALVLAPAAMAAEKSAPGNSQGRSLTVVELFTSQGCSSCPPADAFLGELAKRDDILALSVHVDYWDYIGWKDVFASPRNTQRQRDYASKMRLRYVYTPQMVIQGADHATGSDRSKVLAKIKKAAKTKRVPVAISLAGRKIRITVPGAHTTDKAAVWLAVYGHEMETKIKRGENAGRTLIYHNVVSDMIRIGTWSGQPMDIPTEIDGMGAKGRDGCAVILQSLRSGRILGAARIDLAGT